MGDGPVGRCGMIKLSLRLLSVLTLLSLLSHFYPKFLYM